MMALNLSYLCLTVQTVAYRGSTIQNSQAKSTKLTYKLEDYRGSIIVALIILKLIVFDQNMSDKDTSQTETTVNNSNSSFFDKAHHKKYKKVNTPHAPLTTAVQKFKQKTFEAILETYQEKQIQQMEKAMKKSNKKNLHIFFGLSTVLVFLSLLLLGLLFDNMTKLQNRISELQHLNRATKEDLTELQTMILNAKQGLEELYISSENIKEEILDIHLNELLKQEKSIHIFKKYSNPFDFEVDPDINWIIGNFKLKDNGKIRKKSQEQLMLYSKSNFPNKGIHYIQIKIVETLYGMISIGIMPSSKRSQKCVYCQAKDIIYLYGSNGKVYNGKILDLVHWSRQTRIEKLANGDIVTMFVDRKDNKVIWYVNNRYAASEPLKDIEGELYPFIEMTSRGDQIEILQ